LSRIKYIALPLLFTISAVLISCAAQRKLTPLEEEMLEDEIVQMLERKQEEQKNSAYLLQVKLRTPDLKKKFRLEVYFTNDSVSFYSPGFLGKGSFKGIVYGDSLRFYLPSDKAYYRGLWYDLTEPDLNRWRDVFELTLDILAGDFIPKTGDSLIPRAYDMDFADDKRGISGRSSAWDYIFAADFNDFDNAIYGWAKDMLVVNFEMRYYDPGEFPYFKFYRTEINYSNYLQSRNNQGIEHFESEIRLEFIEQRYNIDIPSEKFELEIPASAERIEGLILE
jgi:hypothetical protein